MTGRLELHHGPGEVLREPVVDLVGDHLPLAFLDADELPQGLPIGPQRPLGFTELPGVHRGEHDRDGLSLLLDRRGADGIGGELSLGIHGIHVVGGGVTGREHLEQDPPYHVP